jgi:hypothetical protein
MMKIGARLILTKFVDSALKDIRRNNQHDAPQIILRTNQQDSAARHFHIRRGYGKPEDLSWCKGYNDDGLSIVEYWILERIEDLQGAINYLLETAFIERITRPTLPTPPEPSWPTSRARVIEQPGKWEGLVRLDDNKPNLRKRKRTHNIEICSCRTRCGDLCPNHIVKVVCTEEFCGLVNCGNHYDAKFGAVIQIDDHTKFGNGIFAVEPISAYVPILVCFAYSFSPANHLWFHSVGRSRLLKSTKSKREQHTFMEWSSATCL